MNQLRAESTSSAVSQLFRRKTSRDITLLPGTMPVLSKLNCFMADGNTIYIDEFNYRTLALWSLEQGCIENVVTADVFDRIDQSCPNRPNEYQEYEIYAQRIGDDLSKGESKVRKKVRGKKKKNNYSHFVSNEGFVCYRKQNILLNFYHYNMLMPNNDRTYECGFCDVIINDMEECRQHVETEKHKTCINEQIYITQFTSNIIRMVRNQCHCGICNQMLSQDHIEDHINTERHAILKNYSETCSQEAFQYRTVSEVMYTEIEIKKKKLSIVAYDWNMICMFPNKFYCTLCNLGSHVTYLKGHLVSPHHLRLLNECQIVTDYGFNVIRTFDEGFFHCGLCNIEVHFHTIDHHIQKCTHKSKLTEFMRLNYLEEPKIETKSSEINVDFNGYKFCLNINSYNTVVAFKEDFFCVACDMKLLNDQIDDHIDSNEHKSMLGKYKAVVDFPQEYVRKIPSKMSTWAHCAICNTRMTYNTKHIKEHFDCLKHKTNYKKHMNIMTQKSIEVKKNNVPIITLPKEETDHVAKFLNELYTLKLPVYAWDCVRDHGPRIYSCFVCQTLMKSENVAKHIGNTEHKDNLAKCVILECYGAHFLRVINGDQSVYCSFCNDILKYYEINKHITTAIHCENMKNRITKVDKETCIQIDRQMNVNRKEINFIMLNYFNNEVLITFEAWNGIREEEILSCALCGCKELPDKMYHCNSDEHKGKLRGTSNNAHFVRLIAKKLKQCLVCNIYFKFKLNEHVESIMHVNRLKTAMRNAVEINNSKDIYRINYSQFLKETTFKNNKKDVLFDDEFNENANKIETYVFLENESVVTNIHSENNLLDQFKNSQNGKDETDMNAITSNTHSTRNSVDSINYDCQSSCKSNLNYIDAVTSVNDNTSDKIVDDHKSVTSGKKYFESNIATENESSVIPTSDSVIVKMNEDGLLKDNGAKNTECHLCRLEIPTQYYADHIKSENHIVHMALTDVILKRIQNNIHQNVIFIQGNYEINQNNHYCSICNIVISKNDIVEHSYTAIHKNNENKVDLLVQVTDLLCENKYKTELTSEVISNNDQFTNIKGIEIGQILEVRGLNIQNKSLPKDSISATDVIKEKQHNNLVKDDEDIPITDTVATILNIFESHVLFNVNNRKIKMNIDAFHGIFKNKDSFDCILCKMESNYGGAIHNTTKNHINNLNKLKFRGFDMIRFLDNDFIHCGLCHFVFTTAYLVHHLSNKSHKRNLFLATTDMICENEGKSLKKSANEEASDKPNRNNIVITNKDNSSNIQDMRKIKGIEQPLNSNNIAIEEKSTLTNVKSITDTTYFCKTCNVWIPSINHKVGHEMGLQHLTKLKTVSDTNLNARQSEIIKEKSTPDPKNIPYYCGICKTEIQSINHRSKHEKSPMHSLKSQLNSLNAKNIINIPSVAIKPTTSTSYTCEVCDIEVPSIHHKVGHEKDLEHLNNLQTLRNSQKVTKSVLKVDHETMSNHVANVKSSNDNEISATSVNKSNMVKTYVCKDCNIEMPTSCKKIHELSSKHITLNDQNQSLNLTSPSSVLKPSYICDLCNIEVFSVDYKNTHEATQTHIVNKTQRNSENIVTNSASSLQLAAKLSSSFVIHKVEVSSTNRADHELILRNTTNTTDEYHNEYFCPECKVKVPTPNRLDHEKGARHKANIIDTSVTASNSSIVSTQGIPDNNLISKNTTNTIDEYHNKYFCYECKVKVPTPNRLDHEKGARHKANLKKTAVTASNSSNISTQGIPDNNLISKNTTNTIDEYHNEYFCHECKVKVPTPNRLEHEKGARHKANLKKTAVTASNSSNISTQGIPDNNLISKDTTNTTDEFHNEYFCHECKVKVPTPNRLEHEKGARHRANIKKTAVTASNSSNISIQGIPHSNLHITGSNNSKTLPSTCKMVVENKLELTNICHICHVQIPARPDLVLEHTRGKKHVAALKKLNKQ